MCICMHECACMCVCVCLEVQSFVYSFIRPWLVETVCCTGCCTLLHWCIVRRRCVSARRLCGKIRAVIVFSGCSRALSGKTDCLCGAAWSLGPGARWSHQQVSATAACYGAYMCVCVWEWNMVGGCWERLACGTNMEFCYSVNPFRTIWQTS